MAPTGLAVAAVRSSAVAAGPVGGSSLRRTIIRTIARSLTMTTNHTARLARRAIIGVIGTSATLFALAAPALADPPPNCTAGDRAQVAAGVSASMSAYLFTHPDVNDFFTGLKGQPVDQIRPMVQDYLDQNPQQKDELQAIRQPLTDFRDRCGIEQGAM
jgi:heme-binding protein